MGQITPQIDRRHKGGCDREALRLLKGECSLSTKAGVSRNGAGLPLPCRPNNQGWPGLHFDHAASPALKRRGRGIRRVVRGPSVEFRTKEANADFPVDAERTIAKQTRSGIPVRRVLWVGADRQTINPTGTAAGSKRVNAPVSNVLPRPQSSVWSHGIRCATISRFKTSR